MPANPLLNTKTDHNASVPICRACGGTEGTRWVARERYAGMPGEFSYGECSACGSLSLGEIPSNLADFYRAGYYSFADSKPDWRARFICGHNYNLRATLRAIPDKKARILDVGCGAGHLLKQLATRGYTSLSGTDPFLPPEAIGHLDGVELINQASHQLTGTWDAIMYHHAMEHVPDPNEEFSIAARLLAPHGRLLIRVPLADCWLRKKFGTDWYQWDAPRHLWLPTRESMRIVGEKNNLRLIAEWQDPALLPFAASRLYAQGRSITSPDHSPLIRRKVFLRSLPGLAADYIRLQATKLMHQADQACFLFTHAG